MSGHGVTSRALRALALAASSRRRHASLPIAFSLSPLKLEMKPLSGPQIYSAMGRRAEPLAA
jgi:hypothetical protein